MIKVTGRRNRKEKVTINLDSFKGASNLLLEESRIAPNEASDTLNVMQVQDGLWKPRWGTDYYGTDHGTTIDGAQEFVKSDGTTELITISGGKAWKSTNGGALTEISGATFTAGVQCYFLQIAGYLYIANGTDPLARYNGTTLTTYTELSAPTGLAASRVSGLASGVYTYWGEVTSLNEVGESIGSTEVSITVNLPRDEWVKSSNQGITWSWNAVSGATRYQLYVGDTQGFEYLLTSTNTTSYTDYGELTLNPYVTVPLDNTTRAPKFKSMCMSGNRIWATNNSDSRYTVYFSGTGVNIGKFSDFYGGGWINLEKGGRETPVKVVHYQSGQGEGRATVLCQTPEGRGAVWQVQITSLTVGDTGFSVPSGVKIVGSSGTESLNGVVATNNDIMFPNRRGWFSLGPQQNFYGILRTNELSTKIRPYWRSLIGSQLSQIAAYFYDAKVFISVPTTSSGNNRTIIFDTERQNWTVDWSLGAKQFLEYTDTSGNTHFLYIPLTGNKLIEMSENIAGDLGSAFETRYVSGRLPVSKLWKDFLKIDKVFIRLGSPRGTINFEVSGSQKNAPFRSIASKQINPQYSLTGMGYDLMGDVLMGDTSGTPTLFADSSDLRYVKIKKKIRDIQLRITSNSFATDYTLLGFIIEGTPVRGNPPSSWKI